MHRLEKAQKESLVRWITEGMGLGEINRRASEFEPPFQVSAYAIKYYRAKFGIDLHLLTQRDAQEAINTGLGNVAARKEVLEIAEAALREELFENGSLTVETRGGVRFNAPMFREWRGLIDDIAREVGGRRQGIDANVETVALTLDEWRDLSNARARQAENRLREFEEDEE